MSKPVGSCPYNVGLNCEQRSCMSNGGCGWFPKIEQERKEKIRASEMAKNAHYPILHSKKSLQMLKRYSRDFSAERKARLIAEGKCPICGCKNNRPGYYCCSACNERQKSAKK